MKPRSTTTATAASTSAPSLGRGFPKGYEAQIDSTHRDPIRTGSLYPSFNPKLSPADKAKIIVTDMLVPPDEWFTQEVIADGNHIIIKVNGKTTVDFVDENSTYTKGRFALQQHDAETVVKFRRIEVMDLSPPKLEPSSRVGERRGYSRKLDQERERNL